MKKIKVIYNPSSGRQIIQKRIDSVCKILLDNGYTIAKFATQKKNDAMNETIKSCSEEWDAIVVCGGDGTVNEVATGIIKGGKKIPVAILAAGTVNDFANYMRLPKDSREFCQMIMDENIIDVDLGKWDEKYFVNVAAGGFLTNVAHQVPTESKNVFGRMAYYLEGLKEVPKQMFSGINVTITSEEYSSKEEIFLFLVSNSSSIGGFKMLAPKAQVEDGLLDCIIIRKSEIQDVFSMFLNLLKGEHVNHPNVKYFKTKKITIESNEEVQVDIDGEYGGVLPATFEIVPKSFRIFI